MSNFDIVLLIMAGILVLVGMMKGLVRILIGVAALVAAFALAARYHEPLAARLAAVDLPDEPLRLLSYAAIFLGVMIAGGALAWTGRKVIKAAMLSWADRLGGAAVGLLAALLAAALLVLPMVAYFPGSHAMLQRSLLAPYVTVVCDLANVVAPEDFSNRYREGIEGLRRYWRGEDGARTLEVKLHT
jgi:membrane protein required for colicin V production